MILTQEIYKPKAIFFIGFGFGSIFLWDINLCGLFNAKSFYVEERKRDRKTDGVACFGLISLLHGISTFVGNLIPNPSMLEKERETGR